MLVIIFPFILTVTCCRCLFSNLFIQACMIFTEWKCRRRSQRLMKLQIAWCRWWQQPFVVYNWKWAAFTLGMSALEIVGIEMLFFSSSIKWTIWATSSEIFEHEIQVYLCFVHTKFKLLIEACVQSRKILIKLILFNLTQYSTRPFVFDCSSVHSAMCTAIVYTVPHMLGLRIVIPIKPFT